jgi:hypothetical protein
MPLVGVLSRERITESAGGLLSVLTSVLGAVGLGMVAEFLVKSVAAASLANSDPGSSVQIARGMWRLGQQGEKRCKTCDRR